MKYHEFPNRLLKLRKSHGLSQKKLAQAIGVSQASINYWEKGERTPSVDAVQKIADFFNVQISELLRDEYAESFMIDGCGEIMQLIHEAKRAAVQVDLLKNANDDEKDSYFVFCKSIVDEFEGLSDKLKDLLNTTEVTDDYIRETNEISINATTKRKELFKKKLFLLLGELNNDGLFKVVCYVNDILKISEYRSTPDDLK